MEAVHHNRRHSFGPCGQRSMEAVLQDYPLSWCAPRNTPQNLYLPQSYRCSVSQSREVRFFITHDSPITDLPSNYMYTISPRITPQSHPLSIGDPSSAFPVEQIEGCKHCVPVRFYPHHCELHYHLRGFIPKKFNFCGGQCGKYTLCEQKGFSDSHEYCGTCGVSYWRRYERGRRMLDMLRPGEKQERLCKWYNDPKA
jgi:hypothetical protein